MPVRACFLPLCLCASMPFTLRRSRHGETGPSRSWVEAVKSKMYLHEQYVPIRAQMFRLFISDRKRELKASHNICKYASFRPEPCLTVYLDHSLFFCHSTKARRRNSFKDSHATHPITILPPELMAHVFVLAAEDDIMMPIVVSHVCRAWRSLALRTPSLWRRISLDSRLRMWTERLPRTRACTLDVEILPQTSAIGSRVRRQYLDARMVQLYMHMVSPYLPRWRSLTIEFQHYAPYLWNAVLSCCTGSGPGMRAPQIEHVSLRYRHNDDTTEFTLFDGHAPRLRSAVVEGIRLTWLPSLFANLTILDYSHHGFTRGHDAEAELFQMLWVSSRLQDLRLTFPSHSFKTVDTHRYALPSKAFIYLDHLTSLTLHVGSTDIPSALVQLLPRLHLRNLRSLHLLSLALPSHSQDTYPGPPFLRLRKFLKALTRLPRLSYLHLDPAWCDASFIVGLLNFHVPRLQHLALCSPRLDDGILWAVGETCRTRYRVIYPPREAPPYVVFQPLSVLELVGAQRLSEDGVLEVVRRMLGGGVLWVGEVWLKDCKGVGAETIKRAERMGIVVRVWQDGQDVKVDEAKVPFEGMRRRRKTSRV